MNKYFQGAVIPFLKTYRWILLVVSVLTIVVLVIGKDVVGNFIFNVSVVIFWIGLICGFFYYIVGNNAIGMWGVLRLAGLVGIIFSLVKIFQMLELNPLDDVLWNSAYAVQKTNFIFFSSLGIVSLFFIGMGEMLLYLHKINKQLHAKKEDDI